MKKDLARLREYCRNDRGDMTFFSVFLVLAIIMVMAFFLLYTSVQVNSINIRNGIKMELNNLSAKIYADTFRSQREANLDSYENRVTASRSYLDSLERSFQEGLSKKLPLETDDYSLSNIDLQFHNTGTAIQYEFTCDAAFYIHMFGGSLPPIQTRIFLTGSHNTAF